MPNLPRREQPTAIETYEQAIAFLHGRINYERVSTALSATDFKLDRMRHLLELLGNPQDRLPAVHIAGTKGKGSTAVMIAAGLQASGYRVGLFTSPHIEHFEERIQVNGELISQTALVRLVARLAQIVERIDAEYTGLNPTFFELTTAVGWLHFEEQKTDIVVLEVGLGGRLDSTNVCQPDVSVITTISRDHMNVLGYRLAEIAAEKCGIIKPNVPVVSGVLAPEARAIVAEFAEQRSAPLSQLGEHFSFDVKAAASNSKVQVHCGTQPYDVTLPLLGSHQGHNAAVAMAALHQLQQRGWSISSDQVADAFAQIEWPVRIECLSTAPCVIVDAAHNWASAQALVRTITELPMRGRRYLIVGGTLDKDTQGLLRVFLPAFDTIIVTQYVSNPRAVPYRELARAVAAMTTREVHAIATPIEAWNAVKTLASADDMICIAGSFFLASELRPVLLAELRPATAAVQQ